MNTNSRSVVIFQCACLCSAIAPAFGGPEVVEVGVAPLSRAGLGLSESGAVLIWRQGGNIYGLDDEYVLKRSGQPDLTVWNSTLANFDGWVDGNFALTGIGARILVEDAQGTESGVYLARSMANLFNANIQISGHVYCDLSTNPLVFTAISPNYVTSTPPYNAGAGIELANRDFRLNTYWADDPNSLPTWSYSLRELFETETAAWGPPNPSTSRLYDSLGLNLAPNGDLTVANFEEPWQNALSVAGPTWGGGLGTVMVSAGSAYPLPAPFGDSYFDDLYLHSTINDNERLMFFAWRTIEVSQCPTGGGGDPPPGALPTFASVFGLWTKDYSNVQNAAPNLGVHKIIEVRDPYPEIRSDAKVAWSDFDSRSGISNIVALNDGHQYAATVFYTHPDEIDPNGCYGLTRGVSILTGNASSNTRSVVAKSFDPAPGLINRRFGGIQSVDGGTWINQSGDVFFLSYLQDTTLCANQSQPQSIWMYGQCLGGGNPLRQVLETGQQIDLGGGAFGVVSSFQVASYSAQSRSTSAGDNRIVRADGKLLVNADVILPSQQHVAVVLLVGEPVCSSWCADIDFNNDGLFPDTLDIDDFLAVFSGGVCSTGCCDGIDFNGDTLFPDTLDIDAFLSVFSGGPCVR